MKTPLRKNTLRKKCEQKNSRKNKRRDFEKKKPCKTRKQTKTHCKTRKTLQTNTTKSFEKKLAKKLKQNFWKNRNHMQKKMPRKKSKQNHLRTN